MTNQAIDNISFGPGWYNCEKHEYEFKWGSKEFYIFIDGNNCRKLNLIFQNPHKPKKFKIYSNNNLILEDIIETDSIPNIEIDIKDCSVLKIESECYVPAHNQRALSLMLKSITLDSVNLSLSQIGVRSMNFSDLYGIPPISFYVDEHDLYKPSNVLESIGLLTTNYEIDSGCFTKFIDKILESATDMIISKQVAFNIFTNRHPNSNIGSILDSLRSVFAEVNLVCFDLDDLDDIYHRGAINEFTGVIPKYGLLSGPNIVFFKALEYSESYNTTLFLETDCILKPNWLDKIHSYVQNSNGFLISGATYDGDVRAVEQNKHLITHLNGGTSIYHSKHPVLQKLYKYLTLFLPQYIVKDNCKTAYDYAVKVLIDNNLYDPNTSDIDLQIWKFINRFYIKNSLIGNYSIEKQAQSLSDIDRMYGFYIIHKK